MWINDSAKFTLITSGDYRRLRFDNTNVYALKYNDLVYAISYTSFSPILIADTELSAGWDVEGMYYINGHIYTLNTQIVGSPTTNPIVIYISKSCVS